MSFDQSVDTRGMLCPLPVLKARKCLQSMGIGDVLQVLADDPVAVIDVPHFCDEAGHELLLAENSDGAQTYLIRKGK